MNNNLSLYNIFLAVAEAGSTLGAAKALFISQPAVSKAISKLEASLEVSLFVRSKKGVRLTDDGLILYDRIKMLLNISMRASRLSESVTALARDILKSVSAVPYANTYFCPIFPYTPRTILTYVFRLNVILQGKPQIFSNRTTLTSV